jgi:hypothetical protein
MTAFAIKNVQPNPFRHVAHYPIKPDKVSALRESLRTTGYWGNIVARQRDGKAEIAYGHHRLVALKEEFGANQTIDLIIRDLTDEAMLQIMARENMEEWDTCASVEHETIRAVVEAYAEGKIALEKPGAEARHLRYAPSFMTEFAPPPGAVRMPYTIQSVAKFIGWLQPSGEPQRKVSDSLSALQFIEEGILKESDFDDLTTKQAQAVVEQARRKREDQERLARLAKQQAEQAAAKAIEAKERRDKADAERKRQEAIAATEQDRAAKREAQERAKQADRDQRNAEEERKLAARRQAFAETEAKKRKATGRRDATAVGRAVSKSIRKGEIGYREAASVAAAAVEKRTKPLPDIEKFASQVATKIHAILNPDVNKTDDLLAKLRALIDHRAALEAETLTNLVVTVELLANRAICIAALLRGDQMMPMIRRGRASVVRVQPAMLPADGGKK